MHQKIFIILLTFIVSTTSWAIDRRGRLGVGVNSQLNNNLPALSFKIQKSRSFSFGGLFGISTENTGGGYGIGWKG